MNCQRGLGILYDTPARWRHRDCDSADGRDLQAPGQVFLVVLDGLEVAFGLDDEWAAIKAGRRLPFRLGGSFPPPLAVLQTCALPASLIRLSAHSSQCTVPAPSDHSPATTTMSRFAGVKRLALIGCQRIYALPTATPNLLGKLRSRGTRRGSMAPVAQCPIPLAVLATPGRARDYPHN
jgi:hypothetical protein